MFSEEISIWDEKHHGFMPKSSTERAFTDFVYYIFMKLTYKNLDRIYFIVFFGLFGKFDCLNFRVVVVAFYDPILHFVQQKTKIDSQESSPYSNSQCIGRVQQL